MRLGVMCSGNGTNFENIVHKCPEHDVVLMIHNKKNCGAKERAERLKIPHCHIKSKNEDDMIRLFKAWDVDLVVLAGYMKVVSPKFIKAFPNKIINIHPSLLPKYKGLHAVEQAFQSKDRETGCTVHYVTDELDGGPIIEQDTVRVSHIHSVNDFISKGEDLERIVLIRALKLHTDRKVMIDNNKTIIFN